VIRLSQVQLDGEAEALVLDVLRSGHLAQGPMVARFEAAFAPLAGTEHAVAVSSGTTALVTALEALGVGPGDEVAVPPFTFVASLNAILERGATARLVDIGPEDLTVDVTALAAAAAETARLRAVMPVHLYGQPADMVAVEALARTYGLDVVEDAAQAHGASVDGRAVGSFGVGCFSFYATKNLTTGEGGMVTTDDPVLAERLRALRNQGMRQRYEYLMPGHNHRMTDLQAALGVAELGKLAARTELRRANAAWLSEHLAGIEGLTPPVEVAGRVHVYHQYTVRVGRGARLDRDTLAKELAARGIETGVHYPRPVHHHDCFRGHPHVVAGPVPESERAAREVLSLPVHPWLTEDELDRIATTLHDLLD
jgi:perosamine synthetase